MSAYQFFARWCCGALALLLTGTTVRGCVEVTEPVAVHYVTAGGEQ